MTGLFSQRTSSSDDAPKDQTEVLSSASRSPTIVSSPKDILPAIAKQPQFPSGSSASYVSMMNKMLKTGAIDRKKYEEIMKDPRQYADVHDAPGYTEGW